MEDITIVEVPSQQVVGIRKSGNYTLIPELLMQLAEYIMENNIAFAGMPMFICHETSPDAVKEANEKGTALVEVAWPVAGKVSGSGDIKVYTLPGGKMVRTVHKGPYDTCEPTYLALFSWMEKHRLQVAGPIREIYPNDPREVKPEDILTEILVPIR
ncbi:MAG: Bacterial transcription activator, effector binding domain [Methanoregulaceae archaeon PtaU1.Bin059]|jgi:effector-binding domain-containing protein|nr:MAG: Bacterial transcription activator, effector binding domain [Methanoregulaceae archaeon PtaB.Bin009]OPY38548.1 MAG: Bacterial transcription activator, effector binding domain [Methanoregulaceae archaeon PtaU1.Bin059]HII77225.1 transcriptional regulator [Methanolinea sp.]HNQ29545.1 GyrI-like domain-containing protein [Methanolinea sp.]